AEAGHPGGAAHAAGARRRARGREVSRELGAPRGRTGAHARAPGRHLAPRPARLGTRRGRLPRRAAPRGGLPRGRAAPLGFDRESDPGVHPGDGGLPRALRGGDRGVRGTLRRSHRQRAARDRHRQPVPEHRPRRDRRSRSLLLPVAHAVLSRRLHVRRARAAVDLTPMVTPAPTPRERRVRVLVTLGLLAANLLAFNGLLASWASARLDLTRDRMFSISPATRRLLGSLDDDLYVYGYFSKRTHPKLAPLVPQIEDLLEEYRALARHRLHVEILDPGENDRVEKEANDRFGVGSTPFRLASKYESGIVNAYFAVVVKYGDQYVRYGFDDLIEVEPLPDGDVDVRLRNLEYDLTRAIKKVVYGFHGGPELFERVGRPVKLTAVMTPDRLPAAFKDVPDALRKAAKQLDEAGKGRFKYEEITPSDPASQTAVARRFGAQPLTLGPFGEQPFYL